MSEITRVINIKDLPQVREAIKAGTARYIGRHHPIAAKLGLKTTGFGNHYRIGKQVTRERAIELSEERIRKMCENPGFALYYWEELVKNLRGGVLICWCRPLACHGDLLARLAEMSWEEFQEWLKS